MISNFQLDQTVNGSYLNNYGKGARISNPQLTEILKCLKQQPKLEISRPKLQQIARNFAIDYQQLINTLIDQLGILQPLTARKFPLIYINTDHALITEPIKETLLCDYSVETVPTDFFSFEPNSLVLFFRANYSSPDFEVLYKNLPDNVHIVTTGVLHKLLIIDNIYVKESGLPTHFSNFNALFACAHSDLSLTKNNWLLFYRALLKDNVTQFPDPVINRCQQSYIAYCLFRFISQFSNFWKKPTTLDEFNWFWHVDLTNFNVFKEIAIHSAYSEYDMNLQFPIGCQEDV